MAQKFQLQDQAALSNLKDTDIAAASVALAQQQASYQAAIQAESTVPRTSLFSFLSGN